MISSGESHPEVSPFMTMDQRHTTARAVILALLRRVRHGRLTIVEGGRRHDFGRGEPHAVVHSASARTWTALLRGSRGLAESYMAGHWDSPDLVAVIRAKPGWRAPQRQRGSSCAGAPP
jgi:cyclopropane-fatty-acyl-phospholipid synthase